MCKLFDLDLKRKISLCLASIIVLVLLCCQIPGSVKKSAEIQDSTKKTETIIDPSDKSAGDDVSNINFVIGANVALNKTATSQSYQSGHPASYANDSSTSTYWSADPYIQWWKVDLGALYDINEINIVNYPGSSRYYKYIIYSSPDDGGWIQIAEKSNTNPATSSGDIYTVSASGIRYLKVSISYNSANKGVHIKDFKAYGILSGGDTEPPTAPVNLVSTSQTSTSISLSWAASTDNVGVTGYNIYRNSSQVGTSTILSYTDTGLLPSTGYTYILRARDAAGNLSDPGNSINVTTQSSGDSDLGIGEPGLSETRTDYSVAAGVTRTLIIRGYKSSTDVNTTTTGPWQVNVLKVDPSIYTGKIIARLCGGKVTTTSTVLNEAVSQDAIAAVNGSYFILSSGDGSVGASMCLFVSAGEITNESVNPRGGMLIPDADSVSGVQIGRFTSTHTVTSSDGSSITLNGINRKPGVKMGVGPNYTPAHDVTTLFPNEIVLYRNIFGTTSESTNGAGNSTGAEALINSSGVVTALYATLGHAIPSGGSILAGTGSGAAWISSHASVGKTITVGNSITLDGSAVNLGSNAYIVSAGPCLVKNGMKTTSSYWAAEGFTDSGFIGRNPRTLVGTKADGTILIVLVDGRAIDVSVGATFDECAAIMLSLGATNVLNLDGGRSSVMVVNDSVVSHILESRAVGDILELVP